MSAYEYAHDAANHGTQTPLNSKLMTRRSVASSTVHDLSATEERAVVTANRSSELRRLHYNGSSSSNSSRRASLAASPIQKSQLDAVTSPQPYNHVRSVVRDLIDRQITPLEARYGHPVQHQHHQRTPSLGGNQSARSTSARENLDGRRDVVTERGKELLRRCANSMTPKRSATPKRSSFCADAVARSSQLDSESHNRSHSNNHQSGSSSPRRRFLVGCVSSTPLAAYNSQLWESPHVASVIESLAKARVPANHVPRCLEDLPERHKYHPTPPRPKLSPLRFDSAPCGRSVSPTKEVEEAIVYRLATARVPANHVPRCLEDVQDRYKHRPTTPRRVTLSPLRFGRKIVKQPSPLIKEADELVAHRLATARVPAEHVPRCLEDLPDRYKHRPTTPRITPSPLRFNSAPRERPGAPEKKANVPRSRPLLVSSGQGRRRFTNMPHCSAVRGGSLRKNAAVIAPSQSAHSPDYESNMSTQSKLRMVPRVICIKGSSGARRSSVVPQSAENVERVVLFELGTPRLAE